MHKYNMKIVDPTSKVTIKHMDFTILPPTLANYRSVIAVIINCNWPPTR